MDRLLGRALPPSAPTSDRPNLVIRRNFFNPGEDGDFLLRLRRVFRPHQTESDPAVQWVDPDLAKVWTPQGPMRVPRRQTAYSDPPGVPYRFSGTTIPGRSEAEVPIVRELRDRLRQKTGFYTNFVFVNDYRDQTQSIGWHADDEKDMVDGAPILSYTLGQPRVFKFRHKDRPQVKHQVILEDNMLCIMLAPTNQEWQHSLPKSKRAMGRRINFTARLFKQGRQEP